MLQTITDDADSSWFLKACIVHHRIFSTTTVQTICYIILFMNISKQRCYSHTFSVINIIWSTRMWANAQRDGRLAKYRWRPLFNAANFGWRPLLECRAVTLPRRETLWNLQGCPKLANRSQPLVGQSSPYCRHIWGRYCCLTIFSHCRYMP